jgi:Catalase
VNFQSLYANPTRPRLLRTRSVFLAGTNRFTRSHTFSMINVANERIWVKFHFRTQQGITNLTDADALVATDRESNGRDLLNAIEAGDFPRWTLFIQVMTEAQAKTPYAAVAWGAPSLGRFTSAPICAAPGDR